MARLQNQEAITTILNILEKGVTDETKQQAIRLLERLTEVAEEESV